MGRNRPHRARDEARREELVLASRRARVQRLCVYLYVPFCVLPRDYMLNAEQEDDLVMIHGRNFDITIGCRGIEAIANALAFRMMRQTLSVTPFVRYKVAAVPRFVGTRIDFDVGPVDAPRTRSSPPHIFSRHR